MAKYHLGKVKIWANAASSLPHLQYVTFGVASRGFTGFQGSLLYMCSVISWSLRIKRFAIGIIADSCSVYCIFLPFVYRGKAFCYDMKSRPTRNSQVAAFDAMISPVESNLSSSVVNSSLPSTGSADPYATSQSPMSDQPSPAFLTAIVTVVKQALRPSKLQISLQRLPLVLPQACRWWPRWGCSWFVFVFVFYWPTRCPSLKLGSLWC